MATETTITRPAPFVETLGEDLAKKIKHNSIITTEETQKAENG